MPAIESTFRFDASDLSIRATDRADDGVLDDFFVAYDAAFVLVNEKEEIDGFRDCLGLNAGARHQRLSTTYGPFCELVLVARERSDGPVVGGASFLIVQQPANAAHGLGFTVNLNYLFVAPAQRGKKRSRQLLGACHRLAASVAQGWNPKSPSTGLTFLEINDPFRLTPQQYQLDSEHAGIDQVARLSYWARMGATVLDWPYVQPALSAEQQDDRTLALGVLDAGTTRLSATLVLWHLERFFAISVLKGAGLASSASALAQVERLRRDAGAGRDVDLLDLAGALERLPAQLQRTRGRPESLPAALRGAAP